MQTFTNTTLSLSVFSGKGGVGKSSLCANLGFCLGEMGHSCLLMDCDLGLANLDVLLGVTSSATLQDLLSNGAEARNILLPLSAGVDLIPAALGVPELVEMDSEQRAFLLQKLQPVLHAYDFLILDLAAGLSGTVLALAQLPPDGSSC